MATTSYGWVHLSAETIANTVVTQGSQGHVALAANTAGTGYLTTWIDLPAAPLARTVGRLFGGDGAPIGGELPLTAPSSLIQHGPDIAALPDGRFVVSYSDLQPGVIEDVRAAILSADGTLITTLDVAVGSFAEYGGDVTALEDGGFAFSWSRKLGAGNEDIYISVYNADGSVRQAPRAINVNPEKASYPSMAGLADGGFVVAWEQDPAGGIDGEVRFRRFDALGDPLDGTDAAGVLIDDVGSFNRDIQVAGLPNGGFVVAYADDSWGTAIDVTARMYNANGLASSGFILANSPINGASTLGH